MTNAAIINACTTEEWKRHPSKYDNDGCECALIPRPKEYFSRLHLVAHFVQSIHIRKTPSAMNLRPYENLRQVQFLYFRNCLYVRHPLHSKLY